MEPSQSAIGELRSRLSGYILQPGDDGYQKVTQIDNGRVQLQPRLIVVVNSTEDVVLAMAFAQSHQLPFTVKGGGHSATGYCLNAGGVVIDMQLLNAIELDAKSKTVRVQMGVRWNDVYRYLIAQGEGLIPIGGGCPTVGVAGFMLGGGYSFVSRSYGLSIDNLLSLTIVTADGAIRKISDAALGDERDLWWACRGGGGGNFGIVTEMEIQVHQPRTTSMFTAQLRFDASQAQDVIGFYNTWVETVPDELAAYGIWGYYPDPTSVSATPPLTEQFGFTIIYNGEMDAGIKLIEPLLERNPLSALIYRRTLPEFELINGLTTLVGSREAYIRAGEMAPRSLTPAAIDVLSKYMASSPSKSTFMVWTHTGGKVSEVKADQTAFVHRGARFVPELKSIWDTPDQARANIEWAWNFYHELEPHMIGSYVNYIDPLLPEWSRKYYGANYARLLEVKKHWDPQNHFAFQQSIGSPFEPRTTHPLDLSPLNRTVIG